MHLQAILFDIDGTLIDSNDIHAEAWQRAFEHFGKSFPFEVVRSQIGKGGDLLVPDLLCAREIRRFGEELREYRKKLFKREYMPKIRPFPGIRDQLQALADRGVRMILATSADGDEADYYTKLIGAEDLVEGRTSASDAEFSKPFPEIFEAALEKLGTPAAKSLVAGDTPYDILAAHRCGLPIAAVRCGGFPPDDLRKAEFLFDDVAELVRKIDEVDRYVGEE